MDLFLDPPTRKFFPSKNTKVHPPEIRPLPLGIFSNGAKKETQAFWGGLCAVQVISSSPCASKCCWGTATGWLSHLSFLSKEKRPIYSQPVFIVYFWTTKIGWQGTTYYLGSNKDPHPIRNANPNPLTEGIPHSSPRKQNHRSPGETAVSDVSQYRSSVPFVTRGVDVVI